eukprot:3231943-Pyramimonas_sp.AAC.1
MWSFEPEPAAKTSCRPGHIHFSSSSRPPLPVPLSSASSGWCRTPAMLAGRHWDSRELPSVYLRSRIQEGRRIVCDLPCAPTSVHVR